MTQFQAEEHDTHRQRSISSTFLSGAKLIEHTQQSKISATADRPARRRGSTHAKYSVSHHMVIKPFLLLGLAAEYRSRRRVWSTVVRRPSAVYDTHRRTKLTAPETISRSRHMVGAHQNLNGSHDLTTSLSGMVCHPWTSTCYRQPTYIPNLKSLSLLTTKIWKAVHMSKMRWFGVVRVIESHWK